MQQFKDNNLPFDDIVSLLPLIQIPSSSLYNLEQLASSILEGKNWSLLLDLTGNLISQVFVRNSQKFSFQFRKAKLKKLEVFRSNRC